MSRPTVSSYDDATKVALRKAKAELADRAGFHALRSVRTVVNRRYDVPALRVESQTRSLSVSARNVADHFGLEEVSAFATEDGRLVVMFADGEYVDHEAAVADATTL